MTNLTCMTMNNCGMTTSINNCGTSMCYCNLGGSDNSTEMFHSLERALTRCSESVNFEMVRESDVVGVLHVDEGEPTIDGWEVNGCTQHNFRFEFADGDHSSWSDHEFE